MILVESLHYKDPTSLYTSADQDEGNVYQNTYEDEKVIITRLSNFNDRHDGKGRLEEDSYQETCEV